MAEPLGHTNLPPELADLPPEVVVINPEYFLVPPEELARLDQEWLEWFNDVEPIPLPVSAADMLAEIRREEGWD